MSSSNHAFLNESARLLEWFRGDALQLWSTGALDTDHGGYHEALHHDGRPRTDEPKRLRVQARQAFSFARAARLGLMEDGAAKTASDAGWRFMIDHGLKPHTSGAPSFVHVLHSDGAVKDDLRDLYDHAFVLLAAAERSQVFSDPEAGEIAGTAEAFLGKLAKDRGGFDENAEATLPRRQNPHMHLLEAGLAWRGAEERPFMEGALGAVLNLFDRCFFDPAEGVLLEFFTEDWGIDADKGAIIEPGHMAEWVWLLDEADHGPAELLVQLMRRARATGLYERTGLLADSVDMATGEKSRDCRLWPQTEQIRAAMVLFRRTGEEAWLDLAADLIARFFELYLSTPARGGWYDRLDADGKVLSDRMPTSLLYHLITVVDEAHKLRGRL
jgi:mannose-6-phosphate isomerase